MRRITVPEPVTVTDPNNAPMLDRQGRPQLLDFRAFLVGCLSDPAFYSGLNGIAAAEMADALRASVRAQAGDVLRLEDEQWARLNAVVTEPQLPQSPALLLSLLPFLRAVRDAAED